MIAACPECRTRYRVEGERLQAKGALLRCRQCQTVFRVRLPAPAPQPAAREHAPSEAPDASRDRRRLVLVADSDPERCKETAEGLSHWGLETVVAHDGVEAILTLQRTLPRAAVLDAALPRMFGSQICELVKRNESLRATWLVLVDAVHEQRHARRESSDLYGPDARVEHSDLPGALLPILRGFGLPAHEAAERAPTPSVAPATVSTPRTGAPARAAFTPGPPSLSEPGSLPVEPPAPVPTPAAPERRSTGSPVARGAEPAPAAPQPPLASSQRGDALDPERTKAERLARIIVSDIVLYNEEKFAAAVRAGNVLQAMSTELEEGRQLFEQRTDPRVREGRDLVAEEFVRVARARGMH